MFSASLTPPPIRHHRTTQIPQSRALDLISAYLDATRATTDIAPTPTATSPLSTSNTLSAPRNSISNAAPKGAALHPNAVLTEAGPVAPVGGVAGLVLRNLERVRAGLKGETWAAEPGEEGLDESRKEQGYLGEELKKEREDKEAGLEDGWQDKEEFEREQEQEVFVRDEDITGKEVPMVKATPTRMGDESGLVKRKDVDAMIDKKARKKLKMERRKEERRLRETARGNKTPPGG